jgi:hypothetical protein
MPTDVYAALSDLAPRDSDPHDPGARDSVLRGSGPQGSGLHDARLHGSGSRDSGLHDSGLGEEVPRDFAPPQGSWTQDSGVGASRVRLTPTPPPVDPADLPHHQPDEPPGMFGRSASASGAGPLTDPYGRPVTPPDLYRRPPAEPGSDATEMFDRPWTVPAGEPAAGYGADPATTYSRHAAEPDGPAMGYDGDPASTYGRQAAGEGRGSGYDDPASTYGRQAAGEGRGPGYDDPAATFSRQAAGEGRGSGNDDPAATYSGPGAGYGDPLMGPGIGAGLDGPAAGSHGPGGGYGEAWAAAGGAAAGGMYDGPPRVEWVAADQTIVGDGAVIDLSVPRAAPVTHRGRNRRRRGIVAVAALGAVLAGGTGYAALRGLGIGQGTTHKNAEVPLVTLAPTTDPALPDDSPTISLPESASATASKTTSASPSVSPSATPTTRATTPANGSTTGVVIIPTPTPTVTNSPHVVRPAPPATSVAGSATPLTARFSQAGNGSGFIGTVVISNPGDDAVGGWSVQITADGADQVLVLSGGVSGRLSGDVLSFSGPSIDGGDSLTYTFAVAGPLSGPLSGCSINGNACS